MLLRSWEALYRPDTCWCFLFTGLGACHSLLMMLPDVPNTLPRRKQVACLMASWPIKSPFLWGSWTCMNWEELIYRCLCNLQTVNAPWCQLLKSIILQNMVNMLCPLLTSKAYTARHVCEWIQLLISALWSPACFIPYTLNSMGEGGEK